MKKDRIKDFQFVTILGWMRNIPEIENNSELMAYALVYGFSQTKNQYLTCRQSYIAAWLGLTRSNCNRLIARLEKKGLIKKILVESNGIIKSYKYCCILPENASAKTAHDECQNSTRTSAKTAHVTSAETAYRYKYKYNNIYKYARVREGTAFDHNYDFEQLEIELLSALGHEDEEEKGGE